MNKILRNIQKGVAIFRGNTTSCCDDGCAVPREPASQSAVKAQCSRCEAPGKTVEIVTLKSLLVSEALKRLNANSEFRFCRSQDCPVVYFSSGQEFSTKDLRVSVFQKDSGDDVPVCYCFDKTRQNLGDEVRKTGKSDAVKEITELVQQGRCACEYRNPQGSCCLGNVGAVIKAAVKTTQTIMAPRT